MRRSWPDAGTGPQAGDLVAGGVSSCRDAVCRAAARRACWVMSPRRLSAVPVTMPLLHPRAGQHPPAGDPARQSVPINPRPISLLVCSVGFSGTNRGVTRTQSEHEGPLHSPQTHKTTRTRGPDALSSEPACRVPTQRRQRHRTPAWTPWGEDRTRPTWASAGTSRRAASCPCRTFMSSLLRSSASSVAAFLCA